MAVQAHYPSSAGASLFMEEFLDQQHRQLFTNYQHQGAQPMFDGTPLSEPKSEMTCNKNNNTTTMSVSGKRNREDHHDCSNQLHIHGADETSTSGRNSPFFLTSYVNSRDFNSNPLHQNQEVEALVLTHNETLRSGLEEIRNKHCKSIVSLIELQVHKRLEEKEHELARASRRNTELEERIKHISAETKILFNVAKENEAIIFTLQSSLEQIFLQNQNHHQLREGFGDSNSLVDDARSCSSASIAADITRKKKCCKMCRENEVSVLLLPCRHLCLCKACESKTYTCPICNSNKDGSLRIFIC